MFTVDDFRDGFASIARLVRDEGRVVSPRGMRTKEILGFTFKLTNPLDSIPTGVGRGIITKIGAAEAIQLIGGFSDPAGMARVAPRFVQFQTAGILHGAYGPRARRQVQHALDLLRKDPDTRQALVMVYDPWRDQDDIKDVPCTIGLQFFLRDGALDCHCVMRSNDVWLGLPYDLFMFSQLQITMANILDVRVGEYVHHAASMHIYERDWDKVDSLHLDTGEERYVPAGISGYATLDAVRACAQRIWEGDLEGMKFNERWYADLLGEVHAGFKAYDGEQL